MENLLTWAGTVLQKLSEWLQDRIGQFFSAVRMEVLAGASSNRGLRGR